MSSDCFIFDSGRVLFRLNDRDFSPTTLDGVMSIGVNPNGHGCRLGLVNGSCISIQWGSHNYCSNRGVALLDNASTSYSAEVAIISPSGDWHNFGSDTVDGWQSVSDVMALIRKHGFIDTSVEA